MNDSCDVVLHGPAWSAYTRIVRLVLEEKDICYVLREVDFSDGVMPEEHFKLHPFGKVPVLTHKEYVIYETAAICRYLDVAFEGLQLQPTNAHKQGRMAQIIAIVDSYLSDDVRMGYVSELLINPMLGFKSDSERASESAVRIGHAFDSIERLLEGDQYLAGNMITLADFHLVPLIDYLEMTPDGAKIIGARSKIQEWWISMKTRTSVITTAPDLTVFRVN